jgi:hypothetical protein
MNSLAARRKNFASAESVGRDSRCVQFDPNGCDLMVDDCPRPGLGITSNSGLEQ